MAPARYDGHADWYDERIAAYRATATPHGGLGSAGRGRPPPPRTALRTVLRDLGACYG